MWLRRVHQPDLSSVSVFSNKPKRVISCSVCPVKVLRFHINSENTHMRPTQVVQWKNKFSRAIAQTWYHLLTTLFGIREGEHLVLFSDTRCLHGLLKAAKGNMIIPIRKIWWDCNMVFDSESREYPREHFKCETTFACVIISIIYTLSFILEACYSVLFSLIHI